MTIESITGKDLGEVLQTINPNSMSHSDEIVAQSLVDASMAGNSFITADYALWTKGTEEDGRFYEGSALCFLARREGNPLLMLPNGFEFNPFTIRGIKKAPGTICFESSCLHGFDDDGEVLRTVYIPEGWRKKLNPIELMIAQRAFGNMVLEDDGDSTYFDTSWEGGDENGYGQTARRTRNNVPSPFEEFLNRLAPSPHLKILTYTPDYIEGKLDEKGSFGTFCSLILREHEAVFSVIPSTGGHYVRAEKRG
ncbi:hypothetical protein J4402_02540 [Candidatus Pacearchaeota archaeon]|nr:hypothetical protein [Candidatus Pacearchaeota archaeon]